MESPGAFDPSSTPAEGFAFCSPLMGDGPAARRIASALSDLTNAPQASPRAARGKPASLLTRARGGAGGLPAGAGAAGAGAPGAGAYAFDVRRDALDDFMTVDEADAAFATPPTLGAGAGAAAAARGARPPSGLSPLLSPAGPAGLSPRPRDSAGSIGERELYSAARAAEDGSSSVVGAAPPRARAAAAAAFATPPSARFETSFGAFPGESPCDGSEVAPDEGIRAAPAPTLLWQRDRASERIVERAPGAWERGARRDREAKEARWAARGAAGEAGEARWAARGAADEARWDEGRENERRGGVGGRCETAFERPRPDASELAAGRRRQASPLRAQLEDDPRLAPLRASSASFPDPLLGMDRRMDRRWLENPPENPAPAGRAAAAPREADASRIPRAPAAGYRAAAGYDRGAAEDRPLRESRAAAAEDRLLRESRAAAAEDRLLRESRAAAAAAPLRERAAYGARDADAARAARGGPAAGAGPSDRAHVAPGRAVGAPGAEAYASRRASRPSGFASNFDACGVTASGLGGAAAYARTPPEAIVRLPRSAEEATPAPDGARPDLGDEPGAEPWVDPAAPLISLAPRDLLAWRNPVASATVLAALCALLFAARVAAASPSAPSPACAAAWLGLALLGVGQTRAVFARGGPPRLEGSRLERALEGALAGLAGRLARLHDRALAPAEPARALRAGLALWAAAAAADRLGPWAVAFAALVGAFAAAPLARLARSRAARRVSAAAARARAALRLTRPRARLLGALALAALWSRADWPDRLAGAVVGMLAARATLTPRERARLAAAAEPYTRSVRKGARRLSLAATNAARAAAEAATPPSARAGRRPLRHARAEPTRIR